MSEADLRTYYEVDAADRATRPLDPERVAARTTFVAQLLAEGRQRMLEVGCGPGRDGAELATMLDWTGVDLAQAHVDLCRERGLNAVRSSVQDLPFVDHSFDCGWSMSTLMHLSDRELPSAMAELVRVFAPGAPVAIGLWGGQQDVEKLSEDDAKHRPHVPARLFVRRTDATVHQMFGAYGTIEQFRTWPAGGPGFHYQWFVLRIAA